MGNLFEFAGKAAENTKDYLTDAYHAVNPFDGGFRPGKEYSNELESRWDQASKDPLSLGLSTGEMTAATGAAAQNAEAAQNARAMQMNESALAAEPFKAGALAEAARNTARGGEEAAAKAGADLWSRNQQLVQAKMDALRQEMVGLRDYKTEQTAATLDRIMNYMSAIMSMSRGTPTTSVTGDPNNAAGEPGTAGAAPPPPAVG